MLPHVQARLESLAKRRAALAPDVVALYRQGYGHKAIAKRLAISPRIARVILIEQGEYKPGALQGGPMHRAALSAAGQANGAPARAARALERQRREKAKAATAAIRQDPLFQAARRRLVAARFRERYQTEVQFRITHVLRKRVSKVVDRADGYSGHTLDWLGCTPIQFIAHLESHWQPGMSWDNYGCGDGQWSIDHTRPCASFDLTREDERRKCFHFSNMQPMWHADNMSKGDKWTA